MLSLVAERVALFRVLFVAGKMPPKRHSVWKYFDLHQDAENEKKATAICKFCGDGSYTFPNATRLAHHITDQCKYVPPEALEDVKRELKGAKDEATNSCDDNPDEPSPVLVSPNSSQARPNSNKANGEETSESIPIFSVSKKRKQPNMHRFVDYITDESIAKVDKLFAKAAYYGGLPNSVYESNPFFSEACRELRPAYPGPPNAHKLRKPLLEAEYTSSKAEMDFQVEKSQCLCVMSDGWTNCKNDGLLNFMVGTPEIYFYKAVECGANVQNAEYLGGQYCTTISEIGPKNVLHFVSDNAPVCRAAWRWIQQRFPHIFCTGCCSHCLDLLCEDIVKLPFMRSIKTNTKCIVKLKNKKVINATFKREQRSTYGKKTKSLVMPNPTRFHADELMMSSVLETKEALVRLALNPQVTLPAKARSAILSDSYWSNLEIAISILKPIAKGIKTLESDKQMMSVVPIVFMDIINCFNQVFDEHVELPLNFMNGTFHGLKSRIDFSIFDIHKAAYLLNPRFKGEGLSDFEVLDAMQVISSIAKELNLDSEAILENVTAFRRKDGVFSREILYNGLRSKDFKPAKWWISYCNQQPARPVAERILSLHPTSCACERNWSDFKLIQSGRRNRLTNERGAKLLTVRGHLRRKVGKAHSLRIQCDIEYYFDVKPTSLEIVYDDEDVPLVVANNEKDSEDNLSGDLESSCSSDSSD